MTQRLPFLAAVLAASIVSLAAEPTPVAGTLPEDFLPELRPILKNAVEQAPTTISAGIDMAQAEIARYAAAAPLWPSVSGAGEYAGSTESVSGGQGSTSKGLFYNIGASQPIFQWGALKYAYDIGKLGQEMSKRQFGEVYRGLAVTIREQYLALILKKIQARNRRFKLKLAQEAYDVAASNQKAGLISDAELTNYQLALEDSTVVALRADEDYRYSRNVFMKIAGLDVFSDDSLPLDVPAPKYSSELADALLQHFVGGGVGSTFESQVLDIQIKEQDLTYRIARTRLLPKFSATAGYSVSNQTTAVPGSVTQIALKSISYGVSGSWTIFDGFATREAKRAALTAKRSLERQRKTYVDTSIDTATDMRTVLDIASRDSRLAEVRGDLVETGFKKAEDDLKHGIISASYLEVVALANYESEYVRSSVRAGFFNHWCDFVSMTGMDPALDNLPFHYVR